VILGPFDLSVSLGVGGEVHHPLVEEKLSSMCRLASKNGVALAGVVFELQPSDIKAQLAKWTGMGSSVAIVGGDKMFLASAMRLAAQAASEFK